MRKASAHAKTRYRSPLSACTAPSIENGVCLGQTGERVDGAMANSHSRKHGLYHLTGQRRRLPPKVACMGGCTQASVQTPLLANDSHLQFCFANSLCGGTPWTVQKKLKGSSLCRQSYRESRIKLLWKKIGSARGIVITAPINKRTSSRACGVADTGFIDNKSLFQRLKRFFGVSIGMLGGLF